MKDADWKFMTTPQEGAKNRRIYMPRGKGVGGSSILNLMQLGRAPAQEYDAFERLGVTGWTSTEFLEYFKKSQTLSFTPAEIQNLGLKPSNDVHGSGPIFNTLPRVTSALYHPFVKACEEVGIPFNPDAIRGNNTGVWPSSNAIHPETGARVSSASAYYEPIKQQSNLVVITGARVTRILFSEDSSSEVVAESIEYSKDGQVFLVSVKKEVILAAGSLLTPQILELSGIGDGEILKGHNIPLVVDLPGVGTNLQDHFATTFVCEVSNEVETFDALQDPDREAKEWKLFEEAKTGMLATIPFSFSFMPLKLFAEGNKIREAAASVKPEKIHPGSFKILQEWLRNDEVCQLENILVPYFVPTPSLPTPEAGKHYMSFTLIVTHPFARGSVHINSADPHDLPDVNLSALDNPVDLAILVDAVKFARKLISTDAFKPIVVRELVPSLAAQTDSDIEEAVKSQVSTSFHPIGTAPMLPREEGGVVGPDLKVYGTYNIRIVDASIIPLQIGSHPMATVYAIGEKAADIIKAAKT
ncbi:alcohol oxidase [Collybia nuda]|uniref:Alcohol oxidase n=1 Tax=Collybia nuda TaxID=64659 RepID=A0A9P5YCH1_9AGAR|nr:alcohol oxidase [Collybia nuda]